MRKAIKYNLALFAALDAREKEALDSVVNFRFLVKWCVVL